MNRLNWKVSVDVCSGDSQKRSKLTNVEHLAEGRLLWRHPQDVPAIALAVEADRDLPYLEIQIHLPDGLPENLLPDDVRGPQRGMSREWDLGGGCEDPHIITAVMLSVRQNKRRLREVHLPGNLLHLIARKIACIPEDRKLIACIFLLCEDVNDMERDSFHSKLLCILKKSRRWSFSSGRKVFSTVT